MKKSVVIALVLAPLAGAQELQYELDAPAGVTHYGQAVAALPDVNGDGLPDFALSAYFQRVELHSGADGALLGLRENAVLGYGYALANAGDTDGDGRADLLVGSPVFLANFDYHNPVPSPGFVELLSGADASLLRRFDEPTGGDEEFGQSLLSLGDVNGDGRADFAIGAPAHVYKAFVKGANDPGHVYAYSGADGSPLWTASGVLPRAGFGVAMSALPDLDADGVPDLAVGAPGAAGSDVAPPVPLPEIDLISGASGALLRRIPQPSWPIQPMVNGFGATLATVPVPGALPHLLVGRRQSYWPSVLNPGVMLVDLQGKLLGNTQDMGDSGNQLGISVAAGDITGDGQPELLVGHGTRSRLSLFDSTMSWRNALGAGNYAFLVDSPMIGIIATSCAVLGDVTGDGVADFLQGESSAGGDTQHSGRVRVFRGGPGPWTKLGGATPDPRSVPILFPALTRTPLTAYSPDSSLMVTVHTPAYGVVFNSIGRLVVGLQTQNLPLAGGVLVPAPLLSVDFVNFPDDVPLIVQLPASLASGLTFYMQVGLVDLLDGNISLSDAWQGVLP
jgi:hypothetical protein